GQVTSTPELPGWRHVYSGKVRDLYAPDDGTSGRMLVVASDRVSAFDVVLSPGIPGKGALLTRLSNWWFEQIGVPNHLIAGEIPDAVADRAMLVRSRAVPPAAGGVRRQATGAGR